MFHDFEPEFNLFDSLANIGDFYTLDFAALAKILDISLNTHKPIVNIGNWTHLIFNTLCLMHSNDNLSRFRS